MTATVRNLQRAFPATHSTVYTNLLVSGCSFTFNNSDEHVCSWPYYLKDLANFNQVYDCSQSGTGSNHIFNSVINEIETNSNILPGNTYIVVMWSGLTRTDVIATQDITTPWHFMSNYKFDDTFATLSIYNGATEKNMLGDLCRQYKKLVSVDAQIYESLLKIIALDNYLKNKKFKFIFLSWQDPTPELDHIQTPLKDIVLSTLAPIYYLNEYAVTTKQKEKDGHPTPNGYLGWTTDHLLPYLLGTGIVINSGDTQDTVD
jgi:hypothetical protein